MSNMRVTKIDLGLGELVPTFVHECSPDGRYALVMPGNTRSVVHLIDVVEQCRFAIYRAENGISKAVFTEDNRFLLVAAKNTVGLAQLCMYQAEKGCSAMLLQSDTVTSNRTNSTPKHSRVGKSNNGTKITPSSRNGSQKLPGPKGSGSEKASTSKSTRKSTTDLPTWDAAEADLGPTLEQQYLDNLKDNKDIYGEPAKFNCR